MTERVSRQQLWRDITGSRSKVAEVANTYGMPLSVNAATAKPKQSRMMKQSQDTDAELRRLFGAYSTQLAPELAKHASATVDVTGKEPPPRAFLKVAEHYALPAECRYPLDSYAEVKTASAYFEKYAQQFDYHERREFSRNLVKRAQDLGVPLGEQARTYGNTRYGSTTQIKLAQSARRMFAPDEESLGLLDKLAYEQPRMYPEAYAAALGAFDRAYNLEYYYDSHIPDPHASTFAKLAADEDKNAHPDVLTEDNTSVPWHKFQLLSQTGQDVLRTRFGDDFAEEFSKDPYGVYKSMPKPERLVILHLADTRQNASEG